MSALAMLAVLGFAPASPVMAKGASNTAEAKPNSADQADVPWLYINSDIPVDTGWTFGALDNGLRYAVRKNGVPPGQVAIRIRIDAGSLMEQDNERGYAHLLEHLTFRQSRYVPEGEAIKVWQRFGATFGSDSNAETTPTHTVYKLDLPNATPESLDESFKVLAGMIQQPTLSEGNVRAEVPVVMAETRERGGAQARAYDATREHLFAGQLLADRSPIGTIPSLEAATAPSVRAFHSRWYRPQTTVISIAGDVDPALLEKLVKTYFGGWKVKGAVPPMPDFGKPDGTKPVAKVVTEASLPRVVTYAMLRPWQRVDDTIVYNEGKWTELLALQLINRRLEARARAGGSFLQADVAQEDVSRSADATFISIVPLAEDWEQAVTDVRRVIADALAVPPTEEEIAREATEFEAALQVAADRSATESGSAQADNIVGAVDIRETVATSQVALDVFRGLMPKLTPQVLHESTKALFSGDATRAIMITPTAVDNGDARLAAAITAPVEASDNSRLAAQTIRFSDLPPIGSPGTTVGALRTGVLDVEMVSLSNGVKALLYPNDAEVSKIMVKVRFGKGMKSFTSDQGPLIWLGEAALAASGVGPLGQEELDRITTGRRIGLAFSVEDDNFAFAGETRPQDLEDQLYLIAAKMQMPRWDANPVQRAIAVSKISYESYTSSPQTVLNRDLQWLLRDKDGRFATPHPDSLAKITPEAFRAAWEPLLASGDIEVMLFGDFKRDEAISALEKTFGALPPRTPAVLAKGSESLRFPATGGPATVLRHKGDADQATVVIAWPTSGGRTNIRESRQLEILAQLFNNRLFEQLREQAGASYAPQVRNDWPLDFDNGGNIATIAQVQPENVEKFMSLAQQIADDLVAKPVTDDELNRITEPLKQLISRASTGNAFWLSMLEGVSADRKRVAQVRSLLGDYTVTTPAEMQALAARYLGRDKAWRLVVLPENAPVPQAALDPAQGPAGGAAEGVVAAAE